MNREKPVKTAIIQFNPELNNREDNVHALAKVVRRAAKNGAELIVTPEMATTGYYYKDRGAISPFVDTIPGLTTQTFEKISKEYNTHIVIGMPELDYESDLYYNSAVLVGPEGYIGKYRKIHQWVTEGYWSCWGDEELPVFDTKIGKISMMICQDAAYFESARLAAIWGADILVFPTNSTGQSILLLQAWAEMNGLYVVSANRTNTEEEYHMIGASAVWSPYGEKLLETPYIETSEDDVDEPTVFYTDIDPLHYQNPGKRRLQDRKPSCYKELMLFLGPWDYSKNTISFNVTAVALQYNPIIGDKEANFNKIERLISDAAAQDSSLQLVVLPELSLIGPVESVDREEISNWAETTEGPSVQKMKQLAQDYNIHIAFGLIELEDDLLYNSVILVSPENEVLGKYQKIHLTDSDKKWAVSGEEVFVFPTKGLGRIGMMIGYDAAFPETAGVMAVKRADIIAAPSSWGGEFGKEIAVNKDVFDHKYPPGSMTTWDVTAKGAQAYTIIANFIGTEKECKGRSALYTLDPFYGLDQPIVASDDKEEALIVNFSTLQTEWWFNQEKLALTRRTAYYKPLVTKKMWLPTI